MQHRVPNQLHASMYMEGMKKRKKQRKLKKGDVVEYRYWDNYSQWQIGIIEHDLGVKKGFIDCKMGGYIHRCEAKYLFYQLIELISS